jgi:hypothetical protein
LLESKTTTMAHKLGLFIALLTCSLTFGQTEAPEKLLPNLKKSLQTKFISENINIDGKIDESIWNSVPIATDFVMFRPDNGKPIPENRKTEVRVLYDNNAIYIGAILHDDEPNKILKEISQRDNFGISDIFGVYINGYNDGQQDFQFYVTASDGQGDCVMTDARGEDYSWDAVWESKAIITEKGWAVEMRIPYAALRFSNEEKQTWGLNFFREIRRDRHKYFWNHIDTKIGAFTQQSGILEGIQDIKTPTRLFLLPYSSYYLTANSDQKTKGELKGGLDIKYGINDAFTLDMILIPDFGQTKYDDQILNLGPFEQQFNENRSFFTEGTDLFSKGNLLYSRRIGGKPLLGKDELKDALPAGHEIDEYPSTVTMINALKVSGRTKNGLGIGVLNAVTDNTYARVRNSTTGEVTKRLVDPLTNYNVLVFDQRFHKNSSVSLVNTNVIRNSHIYDANVTGLVWDLNTTANTYNLSGDFKYSFLKAHQDEKTGFSSQLNFAETTGKYRYSFGADITTKDYDINDLGINYETNYHSFYSHGSYRILNPTKHFNQFNVDLNLYTQFHNESDKAQSNNIDLNFNLVNKGNHSYGFGINGNPFKNHDYYEPRTKDRYLLFPQRMGINGYISSNYNKKFALDISPSYAVLNESGRNSYAVNISPRYRFNDKISFVYEFSFFRQNNNKGYYDDDDYDSNTATPNDIIITNRNVVTYSNEISGKYSINSKMNFNLSVRQYWSYSENKNFLILDKNGELTTYNKAKPIENLNGSLNSWNLDLSYSWWFAPGSQVSILYRNNAWKYDYEINKDLGKNITNSLNNDALAHALSFSIKYFIDYNQAKHWL